MTYLKKVQPIESPFKVGDRVLVNGSWWNGENWENLKDCPGSIVGVNPSDGDCHIRFLDDGKFGLFNPEEIKKEPQKPACKHDYVIGTFKGEYKLKCVQCSKEVKSPELLWKRSQFQDFQLESFSKIHTDENVLEGYRREIAAIAQKLQCPALPLKSARKNSVSRLAFEEKSVEITPCQHEHLQGYELESYFLTNGRLYIRCIRCKQEIIKDLGTLWRYSDYLSDQFLSFLEIVPHREDVWGEFKKKVEAIAQRLQCPALPLRARFRGGSDGRWEDWPPEKAWEVACDLDRDFAEGRGDENYIRVSINVLASKLRCPLPEPISYSAGNKTPKGWIERQEKTRHLKSGTKTYEYLYYRYEEWISGQLARTRAVRIDPAKHSHLACLIKAYKCSVEEILERRSEWEY
ncbi:hypothetical protein [Baaleninema sp.]|uniref:hypothetical protein n=1 Tax=Baaleninema sp. TaxID=3101197 RepID=UPI003CFC74CB